MHRTNSLLTELKKNKMLFLMLIPAVLYFIIFSYLPMGGIIVAFKYFEFDKGIFGSPWVGFKNFAFFFQSGQAWLLTKNTILYNLAFIAAGMAVQVGVAILFSELKGRHIKKMMQSSLLLPYFISWVVVGSFVFGIFNYEFGSLNTLLKGWGMSPVDVYGNPSIWFFIIVGFYLWKLVGYGSIVYLAAIMGINPELYESADLDGANIFQKIRHITLPLLKTTIIIMILLQVGGILRGNFDMFYQLVGNNSLLFNQTDVIDTFVFRALNQQGLDLGMPAAVGLYQSAVGFIIIVSLNALIKKINPDYALF
ncbi:ABC transporter permease [Paenibacillus methanolicus]|uniref:Putative aldouronate transport system permease protein n=1 Tax=Paenibacillus methanolicus TaxID=582686 RepID=A0A5S5CB01_9BACL|nr:ABC transporter permease subunit [Paenibacillus methanolicus]TYP76581.1 putative aldouronate transport system permease protein [Paenibacillus methanolicus]